MYEPNQTNPASAGAPPRSGGDQRGSVLVMAIFVVVLLAAMGTAILLLTQNEVKMSKASVESENAFFLAEAGLENGRATLLETNETADLDASLAAAAGANGVFDFDPQAIQPVHDAHGNVVGFTGFGDDQPLRAPVNLGGGLYAAFLTNDPAEMSHANPADDLDDSNEQVVVYGVGAGPSHSFEVVQALIEPDPLLPSVPPCAILMLGPSPDFYPGVNACDESTDEFLDPPKTFWGTDCAGSGGVGGYYVPTVCAEGCAILYTGDEATDEAIDPLTCGDTIVEIEAHVDCSNRFVSGPYMGDETIADIYDALAENTMDAEIDPDWFDCGALAEMVERARNRADFTCSGASCSVSSSAGWSGGAAPTTTASSITFVDGDLTVGAGYGGHGLLFVTGTLQFDVSASWSGPMLVIGEGEFRRVGGTGAGVIRGATVVADIAGADGAYGTADDCQGGTNGFRAAVYHEADGENGDTIYCTDDLTPADVMASYEMRQFRQR